MSEPTPTYWRDKIRELLKRVPASVNAGGYQTAVAYKKAAQAAGKLLDSSRATELQLRTAANSLQAYQ